MTTKEMIEELTQFYEAAGFTDYFDRELNGKSDEEVAAIYAKYREQYGDELGSQSKD